MADAISSRHLQLYALQVTDWRQMNEQTSRWTAPLHQVLLYGRSLINIFEHLIYSNNVKTLS